MVYGGGGDGDYSGISEKGAGSRGSVSADAGNAVRCDGILQKNRVKLLPSVLTPSEVAVSLEYGYQTMKLFPAGNMPLNYVKSLKGPFDRAEFVAIGGVSPGNCKKFLASGYLGVGMASNLMPKQAVAKGDWKACATSVRRIVGELNNGQKF